MSRTLWIDYLRSAITLFVLAHHAALAYTTFAVFESNTYINSTAPIVDGQNWIVFDFFCSFNDVFFMPLMFFISGVFVFKSIKKKGKTDFIKDRIVRLGLVFAIVELFLIPLAYIPSYILATGHFSLFNFYKDYFYNQAWPVGPPWFIWVLLFFNAMTILIPISVFTTINKRLLFYRHKPAGLFWIFLVIISMCYLPISLWLGQYKWTGIGVFDFQLNRLLFYFIFFLTGVCLGSNETGENILLNTVINKKAWTFWLLPVLITFTFFQFLIINIWEYVYAGKISSNFSWFVISCFFVLCCLLINLLFLSFFQQAITKSYPIWNSLSVNAYGIYLVHYLFTTWTQFALLQFNLEPVLKFGIVLIISLSASWFSIHYLRKSVKISRYL